MDLSPTRVVPQKFIEAFVPAGCREQRVETRAFFDGRKGV